VDETLDKWPDRFTAMCLVDPRDDDPVEMLEGFVETGYVGVRFNPALWPEGESMDGAVGQDLFAKAGELGIPVGFLCSPDNFDEIDALCTASPSTPAIIDHFGHCTPDQPADFERLLELAGHSNLHVKLSEWPRASNEGWPYADLFSWIPRLIDAFGADRLMWGTDFPFIVEQTGYDRGWSIAEAIQPALSDEQLRDILGGTAARLFSI
jgi:predicted TIM-barrel fold metal-dependent hydrolase